MEPKTRNMLMIGLGLALLALILPAVFFAGAASLQQSSLQAAPFHAPTPRPVTQRATIQYQPPPMPRAPEARPYQPAPAVIATPAPVAVPASPADAAMIEHQRLVDATRQDATPAPVRDAPTPMPREGIAKRPDTGELPYYVGNTRTGERTQISPDDWRFKQAARQERERQFRQDFRDSFRRR